MTPAFTSPAAPSRSTAKTCAYPAPTSAGKRTEPAPPVKPHARQNSRHLVILTGLSGSGKSTVLRAFEDMGFYCVDNLPVELIPIFAELHAQGGEDFGRAALLVDAREGAQLEKLPGLYKHLRREHPMTLVFIEATEDALLRRYSETRRPHPLGKDQSVRQGLQRSEEHTSELQSPCNLVCRLLLEKKKKSIRD